MFLFGLVTTFRLGLLLGFLAFLALAALVRWWAVLGTFWGCGVRIALGFRGTFAGVWTSARCTFRFLFILFFALFHWIFSLPFGTFLLFIPIPRLPSVNRLMCELWDWQTFKSFRTLTFVPGISYCSWLFLYKEHLHFRGAFCLAASWPACYHSDLWT